MTSYSSHLKFHLSSHLRFHSRFHTSFYIPIPIPYSLSWISVLITDSIIVLITDPRCYLHSPHIKLKIFLELKNVHLSYDGTDQKLFLFHPGNSFFICILYNVFKSLIVVIVLFLFSQTTTKKNGLKNYNLFFIFLNKNHKS